jgi:hypothetical protein
MNCQRIHWICVLVFAFAFAGSVFPQSIYIYPNKKLSDQGLLEYRRYAPEEAVAYEQGGSFDPYLPLDWGPERRLTEQEYVYRARVITSGDSLFCTYSIIGARQCYFIRSLDSGLDWEPYQTLVDTTQDFSYAYQEILRDGLNLMIGAGMQDAPYGKNFGYFRSSDYGTTWGGLSKIFLNESNNRLQFSSFTNWDQTVYASYVSVHDYDSIYVVKSANWGDSWNGRGMNVAYLNGTPQPMTVRASADDVHLVWVNEESPISCRYSRSPDQGLTWSEEIEISNDSLGAQRVFLAVQENHVVVCWMGYKYSPHAFTGDFFIRQSFDSGETWQDEQVLNELHEVRRGTIYIVDSLMIAVWMDRRFEGGGDEVVARYSHDLGQSWSEETRLSFGENHSYDPIACATGGLIHVLWGDIRPDAPGLYYCVNDLSTEIQSRETSPPTNIYIDSYPNPFNSRTIITYRGMEGGDLEIFNIAGQLVRTIRVSGKEGQIIWDASDETGDGVLSGVYFIRARTAQGYESRKVVYLR